MKTFFELLAKIFAALFLKKVSTPTKDLPEKSVLEDEDTTVENDSVIEVPREEVVPIKEREYSLELWIDDPKVRLLSGQYWDTIQGLGFEKAAIMVETATRGWDSKFSPKEMEKIGRLARDRNIGLIITVWPDPDFSELKKLEHGVIPLLRASGAEALESDLEFNWRKNKLVGFGNYDAAGDALVKTYETIKTELQDMNLKMEVTTFPHHQENLGGADVTPHVDRTIVQAYSVRNRNGNLVDWNDTFGPEKMVPHALERTRRIPGVLTGKVEVGIGLAAYNQLWPNRTPHEAMKLAWDAATDSDLNVHVRRYWSSKHILGSKKKLYAFSFFDKKEYLK